MPLPFDTGVFLGELPKGAFDETLSRTLEPNRRRFFSRRFNDIQDRYNEALVRFARNNMGIDPTSQPELRTFSNFLENFPFESEFFNHPFEERNPDFSALNPRTRYLFPT